jgi:hypothetical protein
MPKIEVSSSYPFDGLEGLKDIGNNVLEGIVSYPIYYEDVPEYFTEIENRFALIGERTATCYSVVSDKFTEANHSDVINSAIDMLDEKYPNLEVVGEAKTDGNTCRIQMRFPEYTIDDDTSKGIEMGAFINHRYDGRGALKGGVMMTRVVCTNGMMAFKAVPEGAFSIAHLSGFHAKLDKTIGLITQGIEVHDRVELLIGSAIDDRYEYFTRDDLVFTLAGILGGERVAKRVIAQAELNVSDFSRYDLYNEITRFAQHQPLSIGQIEKLDGAGEKMLVGDVPIVHAPVLA